jgi:hypothetical protein
VPWCDACSRYYNPNTLPPEGTCPNCGQAVAGGAGSATPARAPWHFWLFVAAAVVYLGWRLVQGVAWLIDHV